MRNTLPYLLLMLILVTSCKKKSLEKEGYTEVPQIELKSLSTQSVHQFKDSVIIVISYKDLNGDLGEQNPDNNSLYILDSRLAAADYYHIPPITPEDLEFKTRGSIRIKKPTLFLFGDGGDEKTRLTIKVMDRAGNWSNEVTTEEITIKQ